MIRRYTSLTTLILLLALSGSAQVVLDRQVIGTSGGSFSLSGGILLEQTLGEAVISTFESDNFSLTQGFHQPHTGTGFLAFSVETRPTSCPTSSDGAAFLSPITGCAAPYQVVWSNGVTDADSLSRLLPGLYSVTVFSGFCRETVEFEVNPGPASNCAIRIFNAFTPDGDGKSDTWVIENIQLDEFKQNKVEIFNRWGQRVFSATDYNNANVVWNGDSETGRELLSGTYFYILEAGGITFKGYIELIR